MDDNDLNDIDMLSWAGIGVAMGNAVDEVIISGDEVCLSNEDDGIAVWIEENVFTASSKTNAYCHQQTDDF